MKPFIMFSEWSREKVKTPEAYHQWLESLKDGDEVMVQIFVPAHGKLEYPFEFWEYYRGKLWRDWVDYNRGQQPVNRKTGELIYYSGEPWGETFPARIVPIAPKLLPNIDASRSEKPVYEPHRDGYRLAVLCQDRERVKMSQTLAGKGIPYYFHGVNDGQKYTVFVKDVDLSKYDYNWQKWLDEIGAAGEFLYSESAF